MNKRLVGVLVVAVILGLSATLMYVVFRSNPESSEKKIVFMDNFKVFEGFAMKKDYDKRLEKEISLERSQLDSVAAQLNELSKSGMKESFNSKQQEFMYAKKQFDEKFQKLSQEYTNQVYERLNIYIRDYGKNHQYEFILGATGDGNVMYVDQKADITEELIDYINKEYLDN